MALWQIALLVLGLAWIVQSIGVWLQVRHYQRTFSVVRRRWSDGRLGTGAAPGRIGKGVIVLLVISPAGIVRQLHAMEGRSVFAKFQDRAEFAGLSLDDLKARLDSGHIQGGLAQAITKAIEQIEKLDIREAADREAVSALATA
jgi:glucitol operon activator protein